MGKCCIRRRGSIKYLVLEKNFLFFRLIRSVNNSGFFFWEELLKHWKQRMSVETTKVKTRGIYGYYGLSLNVGNGLSFP